ncbi:MAG TPA: acylneuraminate cytidylyltransferase family protein [Candidatus Woesebacteria bacterium]|nr:acylneuraminate cytidylyltransferase family protein [Candidatus Woesebacteria bacterium]HQB26826.1 acylneuraminate cytidylyltransferase family protein [Candidatus Paceibacterota bacterium]
MKILGIIPARGGSKRVPNKNIKMVGGKPLIAWSIESALKSDLDRLVVSTDDEKIARIAKKYGAEVPFLRPGELSGDKLGIEPVLKHALEWLLEKENFKPEAVALLMATAPMRRPEHINQAIKIFKNKKADSVISVIEAKANSNPHWLLKKDSKDQLVLFTGKPLTKIITRSQDLPVCYSRNDIIYVLKPKNLYDKTPNLYGKKTELLVMDDFYNVDINTPEDLFICRQKIKLLKKQNIL